MFVFIAGVAGPDENGTENTFTVELTGKRKMPCQLTFSPKAVSNCVNFNLITVKTAGLRNLRMKYKIFVPYNSLYRSTGRENGKEIYCLIFYRRRKNLICRF